MNTYYIDQGMYPAYSATPAILGGAGAQDGDGLAIGAALSATASLTIGAVAVVGNTITVMGVTLTAVASGANATQFNVGASTSVQATNIATALNAATGQVLATVSQTRHQLRNMVYAWASGSVVNIMTRAGSNYFNYSVRPTEMAISGVGMSLSISQFSGGASGCWGYAINSAAIWPSAVAINSYGAMTEAQQFGPLANIFVREFDDRNIIRANNYTVTLDPANSRTFATAVDSTFVVDNGTVWPQDASTAYFKISGAGLYAFYLSPGAGKSTIITSGNIDRFIFEATGSQKIYLGASGTAVSGGTDFLIDNVSLKDYSTGGQISLTQKSSALYSGVNLFFSRVKHKNYVNKWYSPIGGIDTATRYNSATEFVDCSFDFSEYTGTPPTALVESIAFLNTTTYNCKLRLKNITIVAPVAPAAITAAFTVSATVSQGNEIVLDNITGCQPYSATGLYGSISAAKGFAEAAKILLQSVGTKNQFLTETPNVLAYFNAGSGQPVLNSYLQDGTLWSVAVFWAGSSLSYLFRRTGITVVEIPAIPLIANAVSGTVELLMPPSFSPSEAIKQMTLECTYTDSTGQLRTAYSSGFNSTASNIAASTANWTKGSYTSHVPFAITVPFTYFPATSKLMNFRLKLHSHNTSGAAVTFFVNPDVTLNADLQGLP